MKRLAIASILSTAAAANAQSFNVDFNVNAGAGSGAPAATFKAAAGQAGFWNSVGSQTLVALSGLNGAATGVTLTRSGGGTTGSNSTVALTGDDEKLLEDAFVGSGGVTVNFTFSNLEAGTYALYTYAIDPASWSSSTVNVAGSTSQSNQVVGTMLSGPSYFVGATHALNVSTVTAGGSIAATIAPNGTNAEIAGFQLVKLPGTLLRMYVDDGAAAPHNGSTWVEAFTNPATALNTARVAGGQNCEVWVANGFYKPTTTTDRYASFDVPSHLKFYGGFDGDETSIDQRGVNLCYLNGEIGNAGTDSDNCYVVVNADFTAADTLIDGFRIHNGYNDEGTVGGGKGGGMRLLSGSATVRDCTFVGNTASNYGGGVYSYNGTAKFVNCLFYQNEAFSGAALYHEGDLAAGIYNCQIMDNYTFEGTMHFENSDAIVAGCQFTGNYAGSQGGAIDADGAGSQVTVAHCTIAGNSAGQVVGGVMARNGADVALNNSILWQNNDQFSPTTLEKQYDTSGAGSTITTWATTAQGASGNPGLDPMFVDGDGADNVWGNFDDNCRLQEASPCVNGGGNDFTPFDAGDLDRDGNTAERLPIDLDGEMRVRHVVVDRGCFEFAAGCGLAGDLDADGDVDLTDLAALLSNFGTLEDASDEDGDTDGDYDVDLADLTALLSNFGEICP